MTAVQRLKANKRLADQPCAWCRAKLQLGEDAAMCSECDAGHHARCWDEKNGCGTSACHNAPLRQLEAPSPFTASLPPGKMRCPHCAELISASSDICIFCDCITSPDGLYHGPKTNAPGAVASVVWGTVGLFLCGFIVGFVAISKANEAKRLIAADPRYGGSGLATTGQVLGGLGIAGSVIVLLARAM